MQEFKVDFIISSLSSNVDFFFDLSSMFPLLRDKPKLSLPGMDSETLKVPDPETLPVF